MARFIVETRGIDAVKSALDRIGDGARRRDLLDLVGGLVASQTRRRLHEEKTGPKGGRWKAWSPDYARTRKSHHSLLINKGYMKDAVTHNLIPGGVEVGTSVIYGATHQFGRGRIPARPFLGLSAENRDEVEATVTDWLEGVMA